MVDLIILASIPGIGILFVILWLRNRLTRPVQHQQPEVNVQKDYPLPTTAIQPVNEAGERSDFWIIVFAIIFRLLIGGEKIKAERDDY